MARKIDKYAGEATGVEICRDPVTVRRFLDCGTVGQHVETGKAEDLEPCFDPVRLGRRRRRSANSNEECSRDRRQ